MKKLVFVLLFAIGFPSVIHGQATPNSKAIWDQVAVDLAEANSFIYRYYPDGSTNGITLQATCVVGVAAPFLCSAPFPAFTPGAHVLTMTATNAGGESPKSPVFSFTFVVVPSPPTNIRLG